MAESEEREGRHPGSQGEEARWPVLGRGAILSGSLPAIHCAHTVAELNRIPAPEIAVGGQRGGSWRGCRAQEGWDTREPWMGRWGRGAGRAATGLLRHQGWQRQPDADVKTRLCT